jgi:CarD family transcriptional regulator
VGQIVAVSKDVFAGQEIDFLVVNFSGDRMTLKIPLHKAEASGLRKVSPDSVMKNALDTLKIKSKIRRTMWSRRAQEYTAKINSGNPVAIAEVVRDLHRAVGQSEQSFSERQIYEQALSRLIGEYAACEKINQNDAAVKLNRILANI